MGRTNGRICLRVQRGLLCLSPPELSDTLLSVPIAPYTVSTVSSACMYPIHVDAHLEKRMVARQVSPRA